MDCDSDIPMGHQCYNLKVNSLLRHPVETLLLLATQLRHYAMHNMDNMHPLRYTADHVAGYVAEVRVQLETNLDELRYEAPVWM